MRSPNSERPSTRPPEQVFGSPLATRSREQTFTLIPSVARPQFPRNTRANRGFFNSTKKPRITPPTHTMRVVTRVPVQRCSANYTARECLTYANASHTCKMRFYDALWKLSRRSPRHSRARALSLSA